MKALLNGSSILKILRFTVFFTLSTLLYTLPAYAEDFHITDGILTQYDGPGGSITLPGSVQKINSTVFRDNEDITSVTIPEGCFAIEDGAFDGCVNLGEISLPTTLTSIGTLAFARCTSLEYIHLPPGLTTLKSGVFYNCSKLGAVDIPASVSEIGDGCFAHCRSLSYLTVDPANSSFVSSDHVLYSSDMKTLLQYPAGKTGKSFTIPDGVETIGTSAFDQASRLREIIFSDTVKELKAKAFVGCTGLISVDLPENIQLVNEMAFRNCTNLCRVYVHNKAQQTVVRAFEGDPSLVLYVPENSMIRDHAIKYNISYRLLDDDVYCAPTSEMKF